MNQIQNVGNSLPTAYIVADYPYGFTERCKKAYWVETKKGKGQRVVTCTTNPKTGLWNNVKSGIYYAAIALYVDDKGHVEMDAVHACGSAEQFEVFAKKWVLDAKQQETIDHVLKAKEVLKIYFEKHPVTFHIQSGGI